MGSNIGGFVNGFVKQVNRDMEAAKMAEYEQFIHDQQLEDWKIKEKEKQRIDQENTAIVTQDAINAATALATAQGVLNTQKAGFERDKEGRAITLYNDQEKERIEKFTARVRQAMPNATPEQVAVFASGDADSIAKLEQRVINGNEWTVDPATGEGSWLTQDRMALNRARLHVNALGPSGMPPGWHATTEYGKMLLSVYLGGGDEEDLRNMGITPTNTYDEDNNITGVLAEQAPELREPYKISDTDLEIAKEAAFNRIDSIGGLTNMRMINGQFPSDNPILFGGVNRLIDTAMQEFGEQRSTAEGQFVTMSKIMDEVLDRDLPKLLGYVHAVKTLNSIDLSDNPQKDVALEDKLKALDYLQRDDVRDDPNAQSFERAIINSMTEDEQKARRMQLANLGADVSVTETNEEEALGPGFTTESVGTGRNTGKIHTLNEVGRGKMLEAYNKFENQPAPGPRGSSRPIEYYVALEFKLGQSVDHIVISQFIKQFEAAGGLVAPAPVIENNAVRPTGLRGGPPNN